MKGCANGESNAERNPETAPPVVTTSQPTDERERVERFKELILAAVFYGHKDVIDALFETSTMTNPPGADMLGARDVIAAFCSLYNGGGKKNYPDKKGSSLISVGNLNLGRFGAL